MINKLSRYMKSSGKIYQNNYATVAGALVIEIEIYITRQKKHEIIQKQIVF